ncbi:actin-related protein 2/3 complex subunit 5 [Syncephalis fuscata]|nr:actin-related protein 2/3 complex subunit 5 [Syncephalis fuscata]
MAYRKIDVDSIEEDFFRESDYLPANTVAALSPDEAQALASETAGQVRQLLQRGDTTAALVKALASPIYGGEQLAEAKTTASKTIIDILSATKSADAGSVIASLNGEQRDLLMKYLYRGFAHPESVNCATLLAWHEKLVEVTGHGAIIRVLADRRTV